VFVLPIDITKDDSIRTILERDLGAGDWLRILPFDSVMHAAAVIQLIRTTHGLHVDLIDGNTLRIYRSQEFSLRSGTGTMQRWSIHAVADAVQGWIVGHAGVMRSRIAYVSHGAIHVVDADGAEDRAFPSHGISLSPAWSHDGSHIVYSDLTSGGTQLAEIDLHRDTVKLLASVPRGLNITPVYSPDDRWIVFAHGDERGTNLVALLRNSAAQLREILPRGEFDNSSPVFSPDGRRLAFVSARPKTPQIYSVDASDGANERLETPFSPRVRSYRTSPDWSPDGETIAFEQQSGGFQVWLLTLADHYMHRVTWEGENEDPSWAPDSRHLAFTSLRNGAKNIWVLDVPSGRLRQLTHTDDARLAAWSPLLRKN
jgi:TolB protein